MRFRARDDDFRDDDFRYEAPCRFALERGPALQGTFILLQPGPWEMDTQTIGHWDAESRHAYGMTRRRWRLLTQLMPESLATAVGLWGHTYSPLQEGIRIAIGADNLPGVQLRGTAAIEDVSYSPLRSAVLSPMPTLGQAYGYGVQYTFDGLQRYEDLRRFYDA